MRELAELLNEMRDTGVITNYALFGATAQMRYTEPVATLDADVLVGLPSMNRIDLLSDVYRFCAQKGYSPEGEAIKVGEWPVQFIPAYDQLTQEAMTQADTADFEGVPFRVVRADHLAVIALNVGRPKDYARILALLDAGSVSGAAVCQLAKQHGLSDAWERFKSRFLNE